MQLHSNIIFTEKQYQELFCQGKQNPLLSDVRKMLVQKGVNHVNKLKHADIENFVFNSIVRKTCKPEMMEIYKRLIKDKSYDDILSYVRDKRYHKDCITFTYTPMITGIILAKTVDVYELERRYLHDKEIDRQKAKNVGCVIIKSRELLSSNHFSDMLCNCDSKKINFMTFNCPCCNQKMVNFADECIINLAEPILKEKSYHFLLFLFGMKTIIIKDIVTYIGMKVIDLL